MEKEFIDKEKIIEINNNHYNIKCKIETIFSFNSHSDFNQLNAYISRLKPKLSKILVNHGERLKVQNFASYSSKIHNIPTQYIKPRSYKNIIIKIQNYLNQILNHMV